MSEVAHNSEREFWQPPVVAPPVVLTPVASPGMVEACDGCETEFIPGSKFCHVCGEQRSEQATQHPVSLWMRTISTWARHLAGAIGVGLVFTVQTTLDWQAVQVWRIEWLLGASASFLAGILLKKSA